MVVLPTYVTNLASKKHKKKASQNCSSPWSVLTIAGTFVTSDTPPLTPLPIYFAMDNHQKKALQKNHTALCDNLELDADLEASFVHYGLFSEAKLEEIKAENTNKKRIQMMLKVLQRRGPTAFDKFLTCIQVHYPWLADQLQTSYEEEVNNRAPSSADLALKRKVEMFVHNKFAESKQISKQEISNFLFFHLHQQTCQFSDDSHPENPEQVILKKVFSMLTNDNEKKNGDTTEPFSVPDDVSLDMIASKISHLSEQLRSLEKQIGKKTLDISDKKSLDKIVKDIAAQNESKLKASQEEIDRLEKELQHKARIIQEQSEKIQNLNSKIKASQEEIAQLQKELQQKARIIQEQSDKIQNLNFKIKDLDIKCKQLMQINPHQQSTFSRLNDFERVPLQRSDLVPEKVPDTCTSLPSIHPQKNISQKKKRSKLEWKSFPDGLGIRGLSNNHHKIMWRP